MSEEQIRAAVVTALKEVQQMSGRPWRDLAQDECPIGALEGFDSLAGIEATICIEQKIARELNTDVLFVEGRKALSLSDVCSRVAQAVAELEAA